MTARILTGDALEMLKTLPDRSVQTVCTSPPYVGLRQYLGSGHEHKSKEIGAEPSPAAYVESLVTVFREIRRVLRDDGVAWLNLGDSYASTPPGAVSSRSGLNGVNGSSGKYRETLAARRVPRRDTSKISGIKPKDLLGIPWSVALALRAGFSRCSGCSTELRTDLWPVWKGRRFCPDCPQAKVEKSEEGWYLRRDNIWAKNSCLPESVQDRCTSSHEYVFQLTKSGTAKFWTHRDGGGARAQPTPDYIWIDRKNGGQETREEPESWKGDKERWQRLNLWESRDYFYDAFAISEPAASLDPDDSSFRPNSVAIAASGRKEYSAKNAASARSHSALRNKRSVWRINPEPYADAHFATMPTALAEVCVKAGSSEVGACRHCGAPWERIVEKGEPDRDWQRRAGADLGGIYAGQSRKGHDTAGVQNASDVKRRILEGMCEKFTAGWRMTCSCPVAKPVPCVVLDPFSGVGTTLLVSERMGRDSIGIELNPEYVRMARKRIIDDLPMFADVRAA